MSKKIYPSIATLIISIAMITASFFINDDSIRALSGILLGIGAGLLGMSIANLGMVMHLKKHPAAARQVAIEEKDERNQSINVKAKAAAGDITKWFIMALAFVMILFDAPLWATFSVIGIFTLYHVLFFVYLARYHKQM